MDAGKEGKRNKSVEVPTVNDSDQESDYLTGLEDVVEHAAASIAQKDWHPMMNVGQGPRSWAGDLSSTSSFIQDILYEDARSGVAVVDMFVAVKAVKDNLDFLSRCNNEVFQQINNFNRDVRVFREQYDDLLMNMEKFLKKMKKDNHMWKIRGSQLKTEHKVKWKSNEDIQTEGIEEKPEVIEEEPKAVEKEKRIGEESEKTEEEREKTEEDIGETEESPAERRADSRKQEEEEEGKRGEEKCEKCRGEKKKKESRTSSSECDNCGRKKSKFGCLGCFMSALKEKSFSRPAALSEALLGSFLASLIWLQRGRDGSETSSRSSSPVREETKACANVNLKDSAVRIICDFCHATGRPAKESKKPRPTDSKSGRKTSNDLTCLYCGQTRTETFAKVKEEGGTKLDYEETTSDSDFEEALTGPFRPPKNYDLRATPSLTCMGDLTKAGAVATGTRRVTFDFPPWIENLTSVVSSKLIKSKIKVFEEPLVTRDLSSKLGGCLELPIRTNTPVDVFDVTVVRDGKSRESSYLMEGKVIPVHSCSQPTGLDGQPLGGMATSTEDVSSWSEDSLHYIETDITSNSGESDLEEFIEIFLENPKEKNNKSNKDKRSNNHPVDENRVKLPEGFQRAMEIKTGKTHFFEIEKYNPTCVAQDILLKKSLVRQKSQRHEEPKSLLQVTSGEKREKQVIIEGSSSDLIIYIQVEVERPQNQKTDGIVLEYQRSSLGTQTMDEIGEIAIRDEKIIRLDDEKYNGVPLCQIWKLYDSEQEESTSEEEMHEDSYVELEERVLSVKEPKEKTVTFNEELSEIYIERELVETYPEYEPTESGARNVDMKDEKQRVDVWYLQSNTPSVHRGEIKTAQPGGVFEAVEDTPAELETALRLIHEIESDVVEVKLSDAISMLPRLETELRRHLQEKMRQLREGESRGTNSLHNFFSAVDFWPEEESLGDQSIGSEERLNVLLGMLSSLEEAVKSSEHSANHLCKYDSSKIYALLHALSASIRGLEDGGHSVTSLSHTMEMASQLDTAVREYEGMMVKRQPLEERVSSVGKPREGLESRSGSVEDVCVREHLKNVRKKVFEMVEVEATDVEGRLERDFDRLDRLEGENDEALMFLEAFLQKTEKRMSELSSLKAELKELSLLLNDLYENLKERMTRKEHQKEIVQIKQPEAKYEADSSVDSMCLPQEKEPIKETVSGLLHALDSLKSKAKEKKDACKEILHTHAGTFEKFQDSDGTSQRSSRSSFTTKHADSLYSAVEDFRKVGQSSVYIAWTKPVGPLTASIVGYQIHVNEKLNQKVRNPQRLQAVLYSVDLSGKANIQLYAVMENGQKILLTTVTYVEERTCPSIEENTDSSK